jgi:thiol-disulfide isomerase/thioredoxin
MENKIQMNTRRLYWLLPFIALLASTVQAADFIKVEAVLPPPLVLKDAEGKPHSLDAYKDKVVLVNFWATWCPPCREEMPSMQRLKEKMAGRPFAMLGVNSGEPPADLEEFLKVVKVDFSILLDSDSAATKHWKVFGLPTSFLIDRQGRVRYSLTGTTEWDKGEAVALIEEMLK